MCYRLTQITLIEKSYIGNDNVILIGAKFYTCRYGWWNRMIFSLSHDKKLITQDYFMTLTGNFHNSHEKDISLWDWITFTDKLCIENAKASLFPLWTWKIGSKETLVKSQIVAVLYQNYFLMSKHQLQIHLACHYSISSQWKYQFLTTFKLTRYTSAIHTELGGF